MSESVQDYYPEEPWIIRTRTIRNILMYQLLFVAYSYLVGPPSTDRIASYVEDVTTSDAPFEIYKMHKTPDPSHTFRDHVVEVFKTVLGFVFYYTACYCGLFLLAILPVIIGYRFLFMACRVGFAKKFYRIDKDLISDINFDRSEYVSKKLKKIMEDEKNEKASLLIECPPICRDIHHPSLITEALTSVPDDYICLESAYFVPGNKKCFDFADMVVHIRQVLEAVDYLHRQNIYHLNLQPKCVWIRRSMFRWRRKLKISGFHFARQRLGGCVFPIRKVGLQTVFRPPEYVAGTEMDAAKFDSWSVGVIAFEALTGGMLTVESELMRSSVRHGQELIGPRRLLRDRYFLSALQNTWKVFRNIYCQYYMKFTDVTLMYDLYYDEVLSDCLQFVRCLLYRDFQLRFTVQRALQLPLMRKATRARKSSIFAEYC